jgi:tight adherence protein B
VLSAALLVGLAVLLWPVRGSRAGVAGTAGSGVAGTAGSGVARTGIRRLRARIVRVTARGGAAGGSGWVADLAEVAAVGLEAGLDLAAAAVASARSPGVVERAPWLRRRLEAAHAAGHPISACLDPPDGVPAEERRDLALLGAAWRLAEEVGAGAAEVTAAAADAVRARRAAGERAAVVAAGPKASMWLLTALPLVGPLAGLLVGIGPDRLYASAPARFAAVVGVLLTAAGWWWSRTVLVRARRPGRTSGSPV